MARIKRKRSEPQRFERPGAARAWRVARRLYQPVSIGGSLLVVAAVAGASISPQEAETVIARYSPGDIAALVQAARGSPGSSHSEPIAPITTDNEANAEISVAASLPLLFQGAARASLPGTPNRQERAINLIDAKVANALRTASVVKIYAQFFGPPADARPQLLGLAPPYAVPAPGSYQTRLTYASGNIEHSFFDAGRSAGLTDRQILKLADIFGWDVDFALDVHAGDSFSAIYEQKYWLGRKIADGPFLAAEFINQGHVHRAIAFRDESGKLRYYNPAGRNLKRTFLRTPVKFSHISSGFSAARYHPILKLWRAHTGVDYAAPVGTPVRVTASGTIVSLGWNGGYGRAILVRHDGPYSTLYAHLSRYRNGLHSGSHVEQGEIIGYVGASGLATGPHLHYEFRVNGQHRNPLAYQSSEDDFVSADEHAAFLLVAHKLTAQLDRLSKRFLAAR
jgi:murein DD-endopeptidase MepM/ murein hydrolase activator NlpD